MGEINKMIKIKRNPSDDTARNRKATRKIIDAIERRVTLLEKAIKELIKKLK